MYFFKNVNKEHICDCHPCSVKTHKMILSQSAAIILSQYESIINSELNVVPVISSRVKASDSLSGFVGPKLNLRVGKSLSSVDAHRR